jgi:hypothetical protein
MQVTYFLNHWVDRKQREREREREREKELEWNGTHQFKKTNEAKLFWNGEICPMKQFGGYMQILGKKVVLKIMFQCPKH